MPDTYEAMRRRRWLEELAGVPVSAPVAPSYRDLRLAQADVPRVGPTGMLLRDDDLGVVDIPPTGDEYAPEGAPHATAAGEQTAEDETRDPNRWETTSWEDALRFDAEDEARRALAQERAPQRADWPALHLDTTGIPPLDYKSAWRGPPHTPSGQGSARPPQEVERKATGSVDLLPADTTPPPRPATAKEDPIAFLARMKDTLQKRTTTPAPSVLFNPFEARTRARELYGEDDPEANLGEWEQRYLQMRGSPLTDEEIHRRGIAKALFGNPGEADAWRKEQTQRQERYLEGLAASRDRDREEAMRDMRVPRGLAQAIAASGLVDPEDAVKLRMSDPVIKAFVNGAYQFGSGVRRTDLEAWLREMGIDAGMLAKLRGQETQKEIADKKAEADAAPLPAPSTAELVQVIRGNGDVSERVARMIATGDPKVRDLPQEERARGEKARDDYLNAPDASTRRELYKNAGLGEPRNRDRRTGQSGTPGLVLKEEKAYLADYEPWNAAYQGAVKLNKRLPLIAQFGTASWPGLVQRYGLSGEEQDAAAAIHALVGQYRKGAYGTTLTPAERQELESISGLASGDTTAFFRSPAVVMGFLNRLGRMLEKKRALLDRTLNQPAGAEQE